MDSRLTKDDWLRAARLALLRGGPNAVRVEPLARALGVTKGSFYWHFRDRSDLLEALIAEWEGEADLLIAALGAGADVGLRALVEQLRVNVVASERGEVPSDAAIFAWAGVSPEISERVASAEEERIALLAALLQDRTKAELAYMAYLGFILRRRKARDAQALFDILSAFIIEDATDAAERLPSSQQERT